MSGEAISSSILLIGAAVGAAFLVVAILPVIFSAGDTFGTVSSTVDSKMRTDFQIINTYAVAGTPGSVTVWLKNTGSNRISLYDVQQSSVFFGANNEVAAYSYNSGGGATYFKTNPTSGYWQIGGTLEITLDTVSIADGNVLYFSLSLPNSGRRSTTFGITKYS
jgi:archaeal flagellar protein FlaG